MIICYWRNSVYENRMCCNICNNKLITEKGDFNFQCVINDDFVQCRRCRNVVAYIERREAK